MPPKAQPCTRSVFVPFRAIVESYFRPESGSRIVPAHLLSCGFMLIRIRSPVLTAKPQRFWPHCSMRTLPLFSSVDHTPSGEFGATTGAAATGAGAAGAATGAGVAATGAGAGAGATSVVTGAGAAVATLVAGA